MKNKRVEVGDEICFEYAYHVLHGKVLGFDEITRKYLVKLTRDENYYKVGEEMIVDLNYSGVFILAKGNNSSNPTSPIKKLSLWEKIQNYWNDVFP